MKAYLSRFAWECIGQCADGESFKIDGINIWEFNWINTGDYAKVQSGRVQIYDIKNENQTITFAANEISNCVWDIYKLIDRK